MSSFRAVDFFFSEIRVRTEPIVYETPDFLVWMESGIKVRRIVY